MAMTPMTRDMEKMETALRRAEAEASATLAPATPAPTVNKVATKTTTTITTAHPLDSEMAARVTAADAPYDAQTTKAAVDAYAAYLVRLAKAKQARASAAVRLVDMRVQQLETVTRGGAAGAVGAGGAPAGVRLGPGVSVEDLLRHTSGLVMATTITSHATYGDVLELGSELMRVVRFLSATEARAAAMASQLSDREQDVASLREELAVARSKLAAEEGHGENKDHDQDQEAPVEPSHAQKWESEPEPEPEQDVGPADQEAALEAEHEQIFDVEQEQDQICDVEEEQVLAVQERVSVAREQDLTAEDPTEDDLEPESEPLLAPEEDQTRTQSQRSRLVAPKIHIHQVSTRQNRNGGSERETLPRLRVRTGVAPVVPVPTGRSLLQPGWALARIARAAVARVASGVFSDATATPVAHRAEPTGSAPTSVTTAQAKAIRATRKQARTQASARAPTLSWLHRMRSASKPTPTPTPATTNPARGQWRI